MRECDEWKVVSTCDLYKWLVISVRLTNASNVFMSLLKHVLHASIGKFIFSYFDDRIIFIINYRGYLIYIELVYDHNVHSCSHSSYSHFCNIRSQVFCGYSLQSASKLTFVDIGCSLFISSNSITLHNSDCANFDGREKVELVMQMLGKMRLNVAGQVGHYVNHVEQCIASLKGSILIFNLGNYALKLMYFDYMVFTQNIHVDGFYFVFDPGIQVFLPMRGEKFQRFIFDPGGDRSFQIHAYVTNNAYTLMLPGKNCDCVVAKVANLVRFDVGPDLRTNPFQEEGNDTILNRATPNKEESILDTIGPVSRGRAKEFKGGFNGLILSNLAKNTLRKTNKGADLKLNIMIQALMDQGSSLCIQGSKISQPNRRATLNKLKQAQNKSNSSSN